ncbi:hypothetical protein E5676_scaffold2510G00190 [Cucumis melo var. makuwa]|uniref:Uncharacterized protein n=1 Tax=Cucumis melo var. makuwa TaxID=1194695 RepID=A0A5D3BK47_CUCMM|nr:hypothetical protein E5676_scaffold2510G00190 [Cucumis melo var. makuwa]
MIRAIQRDPRSPIVLALPPGAEVRARASWRATRSDRGEPQGSLFPLYIRV